MVGTKLDLCPLTTGKGLISGLIYISFGQLSCPFIHSFIRLLVFFCNVITIISRICWTTKKTTPGGASEFGDTMVFAAGNFVFDLGTRWGGRGWRQ